MDTDTAWERWGRTDPYYGVLSVPKFRGASSSTAEGFFESGDAFIRDRLEEATVAFGQFNRSRALDFGCGVGRLLIPLTRHFEQAVGVDISQSMRAECQRNLDARGLTNAILVQSDDALSETAGSFDFVNSYIVLQHIPVDRGYRIIERLLSVVAPSGVISLQFTVHRGDRRHQALLYWAQRFIPGVQMLTNAVKGRALGEPLVEMNEYDLAHVLALFSLHGMGAPIIEQGIEGRVHSVTVMAQRRDN
ncbi:class I SAM-dependent methyltransferase [Sphingomonas beigongshangi]|uniref:class I SAM-dependent methyltransferase n=1 Tax=Sphingomonas beigongshangi TaxID=2782540 RepID=UPI00193C3930|nr:class I SAM-dependent methyltransferase [Sphingomonas beigongshangi]